MAILDNAISINIIFNIIFILSLLSDILYIPHYPFNSIIHLGNRLQAERHTMQIAPGNSKTDRTFAFIVCNMLSFTKYFSYP